MLKPFRKLQTESETMDRVQDSLLAVLNPITSDRILNRLEYSSTVKTTDTVIPHALGYQPQGWIVCDIDASATVYRVKWDKMAITLRASAPCNIKFLLY